MKLYLAGPDVFLPDANVSGAAKKARAAAAGHEALFPLDAKLGVAFAPEPGVAAAIFKSNIAMIRAADAVLANLTPFRGPSADAGTVWEVGYAAGLGKKVIGYSNVVAPFAVRTRAFVGAGDGLDIEDFGLPSDNLMIHFALAAFFAHDARPEALWTDLTSFDRALASLV
ncbi:MAG TPA: nucleoside 2-deoxyribosyltransferase [Caulobacterales bacterium]|nr:nucleoside 2-deoxyribosyltransferase [Caulobacterales bacterium]